MTDDAETFHAGIANIKIAIAAQLAVRGIVADPINLLPANYDDLPHEVIFNVYANGRARSMTVTQTKVMESAPDVVDVELLRAIAELTAEFA